MKRREERGAFCVIKNSNEAENYVHRSAAGPVIVLCGLERCGERMLKWMSGVQRDGRTKNN